MFEFILPDLGEGIHEAEIVAWHVKVGDPIKEDASLMDVETDKATVTIPSPKGGVIAELRGAVGDTVYVGNVVAVIDTGEAVQPAKTPAETEPKAKTSQTETPAAMPVTPKPKENSPVPAAPATRRIAREMGIDINQVSGSGPAGRVTPEDLQGFAKAGADHAPSVEALTDESPAISGAAEETMAAAGSAIPLVDVEPMPDFSQWGSVETEPLISIRRKIARKMATATVIVAQVSHMDEVDITELEVFRKRLTAKYEGQPGAQLTTMSFVIKALVAGLKENISFNASLDAVAGQIIYKNYYNVGFAADTDRGLVVPVIRNADTKSLRQIASDIASLANGAKDGSLQAADYQGGTVTVTNIGSIGGAPVNPIINYPEVAILGMGRAEDKPVVRDGKIVIRRMMPLVLSFDHRLIDGADAARFMNRMKERLQDPELLLVES